MSDRKKIRSFTFSGSSRSLAERSDSIGNVGLSGAGLSRTSVTVKQTECFCNTCPNQPSPFARFARSDRLILPFANQSVSDSLYTRKHYRVAVSKPGKYISIFAVRKVFDFAVPSCV